MKTPKDLGFIFPAEFEKQRAMWLSWPHKEASWPGKIETIYGPYCQFISLISESQKVCINVADEKMKQFALDKLQTTNCKPKFENIEFYFNPTNDAWCRDHGPAFVINRAKKEKAIVDWDYNAWGDKYPPFDLDDVIPTLIGKELNLPVFHPKIIMEGGSVEFNGKGTLISTTGCLLNKNRNPHLTQKQIEQYLADYYGVENILWLGDGITGDDTDGHIDDITRFVNEDTVVTVIEANKADENFEPLQDNLKLLQKMRLQNGRQINIVELPMPHAVIYEDQRLPASYANFYIANQYVIVPTFRDDKNDQVALDVLQGCFKDRKVVGLDSTDLIWGLGSFHCLSQQEPEI
jgi:agmatine deiminase